MRKNILKLLIIPAAILVLTGCSINIGPRGNGGNGNGNGNGNGGNPFVPKQDVNLSCSIITDKGFEKYGNISYITTMAFDGNTEQVKDVTLNISINITKATFTAQQMEAVRQSMDTKFCAGTFSAASTCQSRVNGNSIVFDIKGGMNQVYYAYSGDGKLSTVKSYLQTTEGMTCVES